MLTNDGCTDESVSSKDLALITKAPGPPTVQPGIPSLQPSIPTSGVASLSIPPAQQTSSSRSFDKDNSSPTDLELPLSSVAVPAAPATATTTSIPYFSELTTQLFPQPSRSTDSSLLDATSDPVSSSSRSSTAARPTDTIQSATPPAIVGNDPKDKPSMGTMASTLVYSFQLPPYSGGLDTSGIAETILVPSPAEGNTYQSIATVYSYSLPPYMPKIPTYVATSAGIAPVSMTSGPSGNPTANARATMNFLSQGSVDPTKDLPSIATSTIIPLYSPACLGNAYGGGYVITPTISAANSNATGIARIPPAYGFSYKLEPTQSPAYGAAVIMADTKASGPTRLPIETATSASSGISVPVPAGSLHFGVTTHPPSSSTNVPLATSPDLIALSQETVIDTDLIVTASYATTGVLSSVPTQTSKPDVPPTASHGFDVAFDKSSSISSSPDSENPSCTTITTLATSSYLVNAAGSTIATLGPQVQMHRVAVTSDSASTDTTDAPSPILLRAQLNDTFTLPIEKLEAAASEGWSPKLSSNGVGAFFVALGVCFVVRIM
ncbi:MAG: hypothetical protein Q9216_006448 [Gyalolechia sp. 2 TL-2023]